MEEALDLSFDRLLMMMIRTHRMCVHVRTYAYKLPFNATATINTYSKSKTLVKTSFCFIHNLAVKNKKLLLNKYFVLI